MKHTRLLFCSFLFCLLGQAQEKEIAAKLLGIWILEEHVFLQPNEDSILLKRESKGIVIAFKKEGKFTTQKISGKTLKLVGTGDYTIDADGKYLYQNNLECEILQLTNNRLVFKVDDTGTELHFKKLVTSHHKSSSNIK